MKTQDINKVPMQVYQFGKVSDGFHTKSDFYFKEGGTRYYVDNIGSNLGHMKIRNSKTGVSKIVLIDSELKASRNGKTYFFQYE